MSVSPVLGGSRRGSTSPVSNASRRSSASNKEAFRVPTNATCSVNGTTSLDTDPERPFPRLGSILRPKPLNIYDLPTPPHWTKAGADGTTGPPPDSPYWKESAVNRRPDVVTFIEAILLEGHRFIKEKEHFKNIGEAESKPSTAKVAKTRMTLTAEQLKKEVGWDGSVCMSRRSYEPKKETWFGRRSVHSSKLEDGTATWNEFIDQLLKNHSENEKNYTPTIYDTHRVLDWDPAIKQGEKARSADTDTAKTAAFHPRFSEMSMRIYEMCHNIPMGMPRHFSTLTVAGKVHPAVFVVVQVPIDLTKDVPEAYYSIGRNVKEAKDPEKRRKTIEGYYTSVESCMHAVNKGTVTWTMSTVSDAKGWLPPWVQKLALPSTLTKDVGHLMDFLMKEKPRPRPSRTMSRVSRNNSVISNSASGSPPKST